MSQRLKSGFNWPRDAVDTGEPFGGMPETTSCACSDGCVIAVLGPDFMLDFIAW